MSIQDCLYLFCLPAFLFRFPVPSSPSVTGYRVPVTPHCRPPRRLPAEEMKRTGGQIGIRVWAKLMASHLQPFPHLFWLPLSKSRTEIPDLPGLLPNLDLPSPDFGVYLQGGVCEQAGTFPASCTGLPHTWSLTGEGERPGPSAVQACNPDPSAMPLGAQLTVHVGCGEAPWASSLFLGRHNPAHH